MSNPEQQQIIDEARRKNEYAQIIEGRWFRPDMNEYRNQCCDCGMVHDIKFKKLKRGISMRVKVNRRATAAVRRAFKFKKDRSDDT